MTTDDRRADEVGLERGVICFRTGRSSDGLAGEERGVEAGGSWGAPLLTIGVMVVSLL